MDVRRVIVALGRVMVAYDLGVIRLQNEVEGIPEFRISKVNMDSYRSSIAKS